MLIIFSDTVKLMKNMVGKNIVMTQHLQPTNDLDDIPTVLSMKTSTYRRWKDLRKRLELEVSWQGWRGGVGVGGRSRVR